MATAHYALFVDLENCGAKIGTLNDVIEKVKIRGDILIGKVYGYTDKYSDLKEVLLSNTFNVVPSIRYGRNQKNNLDIQLVLDALDVAFTNSLIDSFCIVSGDSDYVPLGGKLKSMGKFVLGISRSEAASSVFINACNEFQFLESVSQGKSSGRSQKDEPLTLEQLNELICTILEEQADENEILASELKNILLRLRPDFNEKSFGFSTFGKLLTGLAQRFDAFTVVADHFNLIIQLGHEEEPAKQTPPQLTRDNYAEIFRRHLKTFKDNGFERINPSILKAAVQNDYPDFTERSVGFKRFSDLLRALDKSGVLKVELDEQKTMLVKIL